jgi:4,5-dihydroxyphthalate decarboxylase
VFLSRVFRHSSIYVNARSGIESAADLAGRRVGVPEYQMTAALWIRGILQHEYDMPPEKMQWFNGGLEEPGRVEKLALKLPANVSLSSIPADRTLNDMLVKGELDALVTARPPSSFVKGDPAVRRLFRDPKAEEIKYWKKTGIFPPMHCVAFRRDVYDKNRWIAQSLYKAFWAARRLCTLTDMFDGHLRYALPFLHLATEESIAIFGDSDPWRYGALENRNTIETLVQYSHEQGLIPRRYPLEELFAKETLDVSKN